MSSVVLKNVTFSPTVRDLSLVCADHEFTVLLGPADAGKGEILRLIAGLEPPDSGEILVGDRAVQSLPPARRELALVSSRAPLLPHLSIAANLSLALQSARIAKDTIARRVKEATTFLGLESLLERKAATLTLAECRRAGLARALALQPRAILLDAPLAGLDSVATAHLRADIARIHQEFRATIIYATGDSAEAMTLASHLVLLRHGHIEQQGPPLEVYANPANVFAAATVGSPGMNFLRGALKSHDGRLTFRESDGGAIELPLGERPEAQAYVGRDVLLGIRPEDCAAVAADHPNGPGIIQTLVDFVEIRGGLALFHAQTGAHSFLGRTTALVDPREAGRRGRFRLDATRAHLFDPTTTKRIG
jgi:ABC-type sugar transport system ATPase subunit